MSEEGREGGGSGVGGCGSNMIIGQEGSVAVCSRARGRGIILRVADRGWVTEGRDGVGVAGFCQGSAECVELVW